MDTTKLGFDIFDIRDFFDKNFVDEYEEVTINARKYFKTTIKKCTTGLPYMDGCPSWEPDLIPYMIKLLDVRAKNNLNRDDEYRSLPRMMGEPATKDTDGE